MRGYYCIRNSRALGETTNEKQIKRKCDTKSSAIRRLHDATVLFWLRLSHIFGFARAHFLFIFKIDSFISSCQLFFKKKKNNKNHTIDETSKVIDDESQMVAKLKRSRNYIFACMTRIPCRRLSPYDDLCFVDEWVARLCICVRFEQTFLAFFVSLCLPFFRF